MQFITSGNRIAVENFVLGDLYTITFTNGTYINSACIGIGENFISFQRNEPELLFTLTMATAELVSSIELYSGGTGTNSYNDLTNKPQINDVELVGNKSLSELGIQSTISDIDTIRSGAAAGATAVQPAALSDYQPIISDLDTIRSGAAAGATAVQPAALADYQPVIDSSHKLDADLVDDTSSTHKFATAAQLSQIETNKNNISLNTQYGVKNLSAWTGGTTASDSSFVTSNQPISLSAGTYIVSYVTTATTGRAEVLFRSGSSSVGSITLDNSSGRISGTVTLSAAADNFNMFTMRACTVSEFMVSPFPDTTYQPYALSNAELTPYVTTPRTKLVYSNVDSASTTHKYTMNMSDFVYSQFNSTSTCGTYLISVVTWSTTPKHGLWIVSYSGGARSYTVLSNIVNPDAATVSVVTNVSDPYIEVTASGKVTISTLN